MDNLLDWRGTSLTVGARVIYAGGRGSNKHQVEGEVVRVNEEKRTVTVKVLARSVPRTFFTDESTNRATVPIYRVTVIGGNTDPQVNG